MNFKRKRRVWKDGSKGGNDLIIIIISKIKETLRKLVAWRKQVI